MNLFQDRLKKIRKDLGLKQQEMAVQLKISLSTLQRYEKGDNVPDVGTLEKIAALGVDLHWLVTGKLEHPANRLPSEGQRKDEKLSEYLMRIQPCPCCGCLGRRL